MNSRGGAAITWTSFNYPSALSVPGGTATFNYGPNRQYISSTMPHPDGGPLETTQYIGGLLERSVRGGDVDWRHYVKANGETVALISRKSNGTNTLRYMLADHQGSPAVISSSAGSTVLKESYAAFGGLRNASTWSGSMSSGDQITMANISRRGYTDHTMAGFGGLIHMNGRVQDSVTGRFLSPDPYVTEPGHTQGYNRYAYLRNNPMSYVDPTGFSLADLLQWLCNTSTGMCPPISVPWGLEEVTVYGSRFAQDAQDKYQEYLRQQRENSSPAAAVADGGGGGTSATESQEPQSLDPCSSAANAPSGLRAANKAFRENRDPSTVYTVDASQLEVSLSSGFDSNGVARARVRGSDWLTYGTVQVQRDSSGSLSIVSEPYSFEPHDTSMHGGSRIKTWARNLETYFGFYVATYGGMTEYFGGEATDLNFRFVCSPKVTE